MVCIQVEEVRQRLRSLVELLEEEAEVGHSLAAEEVVVGLP